MNSSIQLLPEGPGEKSAENLPPDRVIPLKLNGSGFEERLHVLEGVFNLPELLALEVHHVGRERGVGERLLAV